MSTGAPPGGETSRRRCSTRCGGTNGSSAGQLVGEVPEAEGIASQVLAQCHEDPVAIAPDLKPGLAHRALDFDRGTNHGDRASLVRRGSSSTQPRVTTSASASSETAIAPPADSTIPSEIGAELRDRGLLRPAVLELAHDLTDPSPGDLGEIRDTRSGSATALSGRRSSRAVTGSSPGIYRTRRPSALGAAVEREDRRSGFPDRVDSPSWAPRQ